jgi:hypothetical protein
MRLSEVPIINMGCNQSSSQLISVHINLDRAYFKEEFVARKVVPSTKISDIMHELKTMHLLDPRQASKLKFRVTYKNEKFSSSSSKTLEDIGLKDKEALQVQCRELNYERIKVHLEFCDTPNKVSAITIPKASTVASLKKRITSQGLVNKSIFHIIWNDLQLEDDKTFEFYGIENDNVLVVMQNRRKATNRTAEKTKGWKLKNSGFILEGVCQNDRCVAFKQRVSITLGMGEFNVLLEISEASRHHCPICEQAISRISSCGFINCICRITGRWSDDTLREYEEVKGAYEEFLKSENTKWKELRASVRCREEMITPTSTVSRDDSNYGSERTNSSATYENLMNRPTLSEWSD